MPRKNHPPPETKALTYPYHFPDRESIGRVLTLRGNALLLDSGDVLGPTEATAYFHFQPDHPCFDGHWPGHPIVPNHYWVEMVGQAASLLLIHLDTAKAAELVPTFKSATAKYGGNVYPTDTVSIRATLIGQPRWSAVGIVTGSVRGTVESGRYSKPIAEVRIRFIALPRQSILPNH